jgi:hypothetical protein
MRFYGFGNYYLSSLQQSLQAAHVISDISIQSYDSSRQREPGDDNVQDARDFANFEQYYEWARDHKTIVLLNGGNSKDLQELFDFIKAGDHEYPFAKFHEDEQSLGGALTSVGIILPAEIYDTAADDRRLGGMYDPRGSTIRRQGRPRLNDWQEELVVRLNRYGLAK